MPERILITRETQVRFLRFLMVGGISYVARVASMKLFLGWLDTNAAFTYSFIASTGVHYALNRFWALPSTRGDTWRQFAEYAVTAFLSYGINFLFFRFWLELHLGRIWSTALAVPPSTLVVFLLLNYRVFRRAARPAVE